MSVLIVSILLAAMLSAGGVAATTQYRTSDRAAGRLLADALLADVLALPYQDPFVATTACGIEAGESSTAKTLFDDADDFNGWTESPPQDSAGAVIPGYANWQRSVTVRWCSATNPSQSSSSETGCKLITVTVLHNNVTVATRTAIKVVAP